MFGVVILLHDVLKVIVEIVNVKVMLLELGSTKECVSEV